MSADNQIPFKEIAAAALNCIDRLIPVWLPGGKQQAGEYKVRNPTRSDGSIGSFSVRMSGAKAGCWGDFATGDEGGDLISLYAYISYINQAEAAIEVADEIGFSIPESCRPKPTATTPAKPRKVATVDYSKQPQKEQKTQAWVPIYPLPVPDDAPEPPRAHVKRGIPDKYWTYRNADGAVIGYIWLFKTSTGGKEIVPLVYCKHSETGALEWRFMQWTAPNRPLYGLDRLAEKPDAYVLLVEGEKCADAPLQIMTGVPVSWPGGSKAVDKVDWSPLAGRNIYAWPDCDAQREPLSKAEKEAGVDPATKPLLAEHAQPSTAAMIKIREKLLNLDPKTQWHWVKIPEIGAKPSGWDVADALEEGVTHETLREMILNVRPHEDLVRNSINSESNLGAISAAAGDLPSGDGDDGDDIPKWKAFLHRRKEEIVPCLSNIVDILENDPRWEGVIAYDEFSMLVVKLKKPPYWDNKGEIGEWDDVDDGLTAVWLTKIYRFAPSASLVAEAVELMAHGNTINPPRMWLDSLQWDGTYRLDRWLLDFLGVELTDYTRRVARWFVMGMVKRIYEPGAKFDYCLVLGGDQGLKKSTALSVLGGEWFGDTDMDLNNKDSMEAIRGKMLYEFSELGSLAKSEATKQKSFLARQKDEFRQAYGRRTITCKRTVIFSGTTNEWEWNKDPTGGRRWWPVLVTNEVDAAGLAEVRDQLFAEAKARLESGHKYWPDAEEQRKFFDIEQLRVQVQDGLVDALWEKVRLQAEPFSAHFAATEFLGMQVKDLTRDIQTRLGTALRNLGCKKIDKRLDKVCRTWYLPPPLADGQHVVGDTKDGFEDEITF